MDERGGADGALIRVDDRADFLNSVGIDRREMERSRLEAEPMTEQSGQRGTDRKGWARGLEPAIVWQGLAGLAALPRRSEQEQRGRAHLLDRPPSPRLVAP